MEQRRVGVFGGIAGRILTSTLGIGTVLTAVILGVGAGLLIAISFASGAESVASLGLPALAIAALARLALNAREGDWSGSILSTAGGGWNEVGRVVAGSLALGACWSIPLLIIGAMSGGETSQVPPGSGMMLPGLPQPPVLLMFYAMSGLFLQPAALIVATGARRFADNFSMEHWSELFTGRVGDLLLLCALNVGGPALLYLLLFPVAIGALFTMPSAAFVGIGLGCAFVMSFWLTLLARLCGAFIGGDAEVELGGITAAEPAAPGAAEGPAPTPSPARPAEPGTAKRFSAPPAPGLPTLSDPPPPLSTFPAGPASPQPPLAVPAPQTAAAVPEQQSAAAGPGHQTAAAGPVTPAGSSAGLPPLIDAETHAEMARLRFEEDPEAGIDALEELRKSYAPDPSILVALAELSSRAGQPERAARVAKDGVATCLEAGATEAAARLLAAAGEGVRHVLPELEKEQVLALAGELKPLGELRQSARVYAAVLRDDSAEIRAIKGLLQIAEMLQRQPGEEDAAAKIYGFVLDACPDSPLAAFAEEGLSRLKHRGVTA